MIMHTPESLNFNLALQFELEWLKANHPKKLELISFLEAHFQTMRQAAGYQSPKEKEWVNVLYSK